MMSCLSPFIAVLFSTPLAALATAGAVAALPVIIHLLNRKRYVVVPWAAMRFLLAAQKRNVRRLRLEQWLLLAVRVLIGVLIVSAMLAIMPWAEPLWLKIVPGSQSKVEPHGRTHRIIVIDGSFSMATRLDGDGGGEGDRFALAKAQAKAVLERAKPGDGCSVIFLASIAQSLVPGPADDRRRVAEEIDELELPHGSADVAGGLRLAIEMANRPLGNYGRREVVFITDLKRSGWPLTPAGADPALDTSPGETRAPGPLAELGKLADLVFIDVARQDVDNISVSSLTLEDLLPLVDVNTAAKVIVQNHGKSDLDELQVELRVGRAPRPGEKLILQDVGKAIVAVKAFGSATITFELKKQNRFREAGDYVLQAQAGKDDLRLDNVRSLAFTVRSTIPVLVVDGKISAEPLDTPGEWVRRALRPPLANGVPPVSPALPTLIDAAQFADRFRADLAKYDCVFLCDVPSISLAEAERLEAHLRRGGSVVISLGPNAAANSKEYNDILHADGKGILPGKILGVRQAAGQEYFTLFADKEAFNQPPLNAYHDDRERAALTLPQFHQYVRLLAPATGPARRLFSFLPINSGTDEAGGAKGAVGLDPAVIDYPRHRGRVIVYTSTFNPEHMGRDQVWSNWPLHPTFLPFCHETLRYLVAGGNRRNLLAGEPLEEYLPAASTGLKARLIRGEGNAETEIETAEVASRDESAVASFSKTELSGIYRVSTASRPDSLFCVNVPVAAPGGGAESDLRRWSPAALQAEAREAFLQVVRQADEVQTRSRAARTGEMVIAVERPEPQGSNVAWFLLSLAFVLMLLEVYLAWRLGSARASTKNAMQSAPARRPLAVTLAWLLPSLGGLLLLGTWAHAVITDDFLGYLPASWRLELERTLDVPEAVPGEGTRWRLKSMPYITGAWNSDRWMVGALALLSIGYVGFLYRRERIGHPVAAHRRWFSDPRLGPAALRIQLLLITLFVLLPQIRLLFEREAFPDVVIIFDDSKSMASVELFSDPVLREKSEELKAAWAELAKPRIEKIEKRIAELQAKRPLASPAAAASLRDELARLEKRLNDLRTPHRLNLIKALLASGAQDWLQTLLRERKMRVHLYRASAELTRIAEISDPGQCARMLEEIIDIIPEGESSRLGDVINAVLKTFRGKSLNAVIMFTDGQTTNGEEPWQAAVLAKRMKVPLFFVGVGDLTPRPDIIVSDLRAEREINVKDRLVFDVRVTSQGTGLPATVPVHLDEKMDDGTLIRRDSQSVTISDKPVRLTYVPETTGDKVFVVEVPVQEGETDARNNRVEHEVHVAEMKRVRVLLIDKGPRYEFRFIKSFFERESQQVRGNKSVELHVLLTGAGKDFYKEDKSAIAEFPGCEALRSYDVIILGDVDPKQFPHEQAQLKLIADFVRERGGGLLLIAGPHFSPHAYAAADLADVLPVTTEGLPPPAAPQADDPPITQEYRPSLTTIGQNHPIFRFVGDAAENAAIWNRLKPMLWYAKGYRRKPAAEVLAVHPERLADASPGGTKDEPHPLVLQQFVGGGRVMFFGFDETWRWRYRSDEPRFNQFWLQTIRSLARNRVGRIEVSVPAKTFRRDDPIRITVRFPDDAPAPSPQEFVEVNVERQPLRLPGRDSVAGEAEIQKLQLAAKENTRGTFETLLTRTAEGEYKFVLATPVVTGRPPKAEATVLPPKGELEDIRLNEAGLRKAAIESSGEYLTLDRAAELLERIPDGPRVALDQPCPPFPLWNQAIVFGLVFTMPLTEWLLRKRARLL